MTKKTNDRRRFAAPPPAPAFPVPEQPGIPMPPFGAPPFGTPSLTPLIRQGRRTAALLCGLAVLALPLTGCRSRGYTDGQSDTNSRFDDSFSQSSTQPDSGSDTAGANSQNSGSQSDSAAGPDSGSDAAQSGGDSMSDGEDGGASSSEEDGQPDDDSDTADSASEDAPAMAVLHAQTPAGSAGYVTVDVAADWPLTLVNDSHRLPQDYQPPLATVTGSEKQLHTTAAAALDKMLAAAAADGLPCHVVSGYRSIRYQEGLFNRKVQSYLDGGLDAAAAEAEAAKWVARPGASEHALGLAVDIVSGDWYLHHDDLTEDFADTPQFAWLTANAPQYGFILRYPQDAEDVTGVHYEPWHYRYVGDAAADIAASGLPLESWLAGD